MLEHEDPTQIERAVEGFKRGELLQTLVPNPSGEWDYSWSVDNWGCKWDVGGDTDPVITNPNMVTFVFDSAWAPPIAAYEKLYDQGFKIYAMYYESGMAFAGIWEDGYDDYYEFSDMNSGEVADMLPQELDNEFGISECMAEYEAEDEEPLTEWYEQGVEDKGLAPHTLDKEEPND